MARPNRLNSRPISVSFPQAILDEIDNAPDIKNRSKYIVKAVSDTLYQSETTVSDAGPNQLMKQLLAMDLREQPLNSFNPQYIDDLQMQLLAIKVALRKAKEE